MDKNKILWTYFNDKTFKQVYIKNISEIKDRDPNFLHWLHFSTENTKAIDDLCKDFKLHPLVIEDLLDLGQRPKFEAHKDYSFLILEGFYYNEAHELQDTQLGFIFSDNLLITILNTNEHEKYSFIKQMPRLKLLRKHELDFLLHFIINAFIDLQFELIELIGNKIDGIEDKVLQQPNKAELNSIYHIKRDLIYIRKSLWASQNAVNALENNQAYLTEQSHFYFQDIHNQLTQAINLTEIYREICSNMLDTYLSSLGNHTNDIMKVLTIFSTIFIPLTFLSSIYGMNFKYFPEIHFRYGYLMFWIISAIISLLMFIYFKKKDWL